MSAAEAGHVRRPLWQGVQAVSGLWFPADRLAADVRGARMLAAWTCGSRAYRFAAGDALLFAQTRSLTCADAPGLPLCRIEGGLSSGPLTAAERAAAPAADIVLISGAEVIALRFDQAAPIDLSEAIDLRDPPVLESYDCRVASPALTLPQLTGNTVRGVLGDAIPPRSEESDAFLRRLAGKRPAPRGDRNAARDHGLGAARDGLSGWGYALLFKLAPWLASTSPANPAALAPRRRPARPQAWRERLARLAVASRVARLIGYRQGAYLRRMMAMFEDGDLDEALRNALPLDGLAQSIGQAFGAPQRRANLRLSSRLEAASNLHLGEDLQRQLRAMYRAAFEKFDRQGSIDEAVFVLAELLNVRQEALDYLVKHDRAAQAAELALGWDMPAPMIIRLLMLAGDTHRALQVARRDRAFSDAIGLLQEGHPALADALRLEWSRALVESGDWLAAVDAAWPLPHAREQATQWLLAAEAGGEVLSARALVQRAILLPDTLERYAARIETLSDPTADAVARSALADALLAVRGRGGALPGLATSVLPAIAADRAAGRNALQEQELRRLLKASGDPYLTADVPSWSGLGAAETPIWQRSEPLPLQAPAAGLVDVHDVAALPGHRYLVALGEAGVAIVDARGRTTRRYPVPAFRLVIADSGWVALAIAPRERTSRVSRLDLVDHTATDLGVAALQHAATRFDGIGWSVVADDRILVVDTGKSMRDILWHVGDFPAPIVAAGFFSDREIYLINGPRDLHAWTYFLPGRRLAAPSEIAWADGRLPPLVHRQCPLLQPRLRTGGAGLELCHRNAVGEQRWRLCADETDMAFECSFAALELGLLVGLHWADRSRYFVVRLSDGACMADLAWPGATRAAVREQPGHLLFHDATGRVLDVDTQRSLARTTVVQ